jgi:hypothetical protein
MNFKVILSFTISLFFVFIQSTWAGGNDSRVLQSIQQCLPKAEVGPPYQYSLADYKDEKSSRWLLIRALDGPIVAPSYSVVEIKNKTCKNYHKYPVSDLSNTQSIPRSVIARFTSRMRADFDIAYKNSVKNIQKQHPGKSMNELQRLGVFGLDGL